MQLSSFLEERNDGAGFWRAKIQSRSCLVTNSFILGNVHVLLKRQGHALESL